MQMCWTMSNHNQAKQPLIMHTKTRDCKNNYITMTLCWQTDPYNGQKGCLSVCLRLCEGWGGAAKMLCPFAIVDPLPWRMTIKPSAALPCSDYPPTWWVLRDHFFDSRHESTQLKAYKNAEHDTTKEERSGVSCKLFPLTLDICLTSKALFWILWEVVALVSIKM